MHKGILPKTKFIMQCVKWIYILKFCPPPFRGHEKFIFRTCQYENTNSRHVKSPTSGIPLWSPFFNFSSTLNTHMHILCLWTEPRMLSNAVFQSSPWYDVRQERSPSAIPWSIVFRVYKFVIRFYVIGESNLLTLLTLLYGEIIFLHVAMCHGEFLFLLLGMFLITAS